ncbi:MAG: hypothetical protein EBY24_23700, partial [Betaproteobacteria bacterium]|nr:hypothetical protein [Betaproteobacteria bacterium]
MNAARRQHKRRLWPRGLREPRPGYFAWAKPDGTILPIGRVPLNVAISEALAANMHIEGQRATLVERLSGKARTVADLLDKMPAQDKPNTAKSCRSLDKIIRAKLGHHACAELKTLHCADLLESIADGGKARSAQAVRSRLIAVCVRGIELGWMERNPASATRRPDVEVKRGRLTLEAFQAIYARAPEVAEWLQQAMMLGIVTGADRSTIAALQRADVTAEHLRV